MWTGITTAIDSLLPSFIRDDAISHLFRCDCSPIHDMVPAVDLQPSCRESVRIGPWESISEKEVDEAEKASELKQLKRVQMCCSRKPSMLEMSGNLCS